MPFEQPLIESGIAYPTPLHYFYAQMTTSLAERAVLAALPATAIKNHLRATPRAVTPRRDWTSDVQVAAMRRAMEHLFAPGTAALNRLLATGGTTITHASGPGDTFWGLNSATKAGENRLGLLLMEIRKERGREQEIRETRARLLGPNAPPLPQQRPPSLQDAPPLGAHARIALFEQAKAAAASTDLSSIGAPDPVARINPASSPQPLRQPLPPIDRVTPRFPLKQRPLKQRPVKRRPVRQATSLQEPVRPPVPRPELKHDNPLSNRLQRLAAELRTRIFSEALHARTISIQPARSAPKDPTRPKKPKSLPAHWFNLTVDYELPLVEYGIMYRTPAHYIAAMKTTSRDERLAISQLSAAYLRLHRSDFPPAHAIRSDWASIEQDVVRHAVAHCFLPSTEALDRLLDTVKHTPIYWYTTDRSDLIWGVDPKTNAGENRLGLILTDLRAERQQHRTETLSPTPRFAYTYGGVRSAEAGAALAFLADHLARAGAIMRLAASQDVNVACPIAEHLKLTGQYKGLSPTTTIPNYGVNDPVQTSIRDQRHLEVYTRLGTSQWKETAGFYDINNTGVERDAQDAFKRLGYRGSYRYPQRLCALVGSEIDVTPSSVSFPNRSKFLVCHLPIIDDRTREKDAAWRNLAERVHVPVYNLAFERDHERFLIHVGAILSQLNVDNVQAILAEARPLVAACAPLSREHATNERNQYDTNLRAPTTPERHLLAVEREAREVLLALNWPAHDVARTDMPWSTVTGLVLAADDTHAVIHNGDGSYRLFEQSALSNHLDRGQTAYLARRGDEITALGIGGSTPALEQTLSR